MTSVDLARAKSLLSYSAETGEFMWVNPRGRAKAGRPAGSLDRYGYRQILIDGRQVLAHRLAWAFVHGAWPDKQIDHINSLRDDNRLTNIRPASGSENQQNVSKRKGATSHYLGVTWHKAARKWHAKIQAAGQRYSLGYFDNEDEAHMAYLRAKSRLHTFNATLRTGAGSNGPST